MSKRASKGPVAYVPKTCLKVEGLMLQKGALVAVSVDPSTFEVEVVLLPPDDSNPEIGNIVIPVGRLNPRGINRKTSINLYEMFLSIIDGEGGIEDALAHNLVKGLKKTNPLVLRNNEKSLKAEFTSNGQRFSGKIRNTKISA